MQSVNLSASAWTFGDSGGGEVTLFGKSFWHECIAFWNCGEFRSICFIACITAGVSGPGSGKFGKPWVWRHCTYRNCTDWLPELPFGVNAVFGLVVAVDPRLATPGLDPPPQPATSTLINATPEQMAAVRIARQLRVRNEAESTARSR